MFVEFFKKNLENFYNYDIAFCIIVQISKSTHMGPVFVYVSTLFCPDSYTIEPKFR